MSQSAATDSVALAAIVEALVDCLKASRIVLFGSQAKGEALEESDFDLLVVADTPLSPVERLYVARKATRGFAVPLDLLIYTPDEYDQLKHWKSSAVAIAESEGRVLYEAA